MPWITDLVDYVEENLKSDITVEDMAAISGYSVRHFQRIFRERTGDSIMDYVRGRRLTEAMSEITSSQRPIIDIALDFQFESQQSFTRAFQTRFLFPPRRFRNNLLRNPPSAKQRISQPYLNMISRQELTLEPEIILREEKHFIGLQIKEDIDSFADTSLLPGISALAASFKQRRPEIDETWLADSNTNELLIITYRVPKEERMEGDGIVLMVALETNSAAHSLPGMNTISVQRSRYAKFVYSGAIQKFNLASYYVAGCWFPRSKYWVGNAPLFNYMQIQGVNSETNRSTYLLPLRERHDRMIDRWWEH